MANPGQIKAIHTVKQKLSISREDYEQILAAYNAKSSKDLNSADAHDLLTKLIAQAQRLGVWHQIAQEARPGMASKKKLAAIRAKWRVVSRASPDKQECALNTFIKNKTGISVISWLTNDAAKKVLIILTQMEKQLEVSHAKQ